MNGRIARSSAAFALTILTLLGGPVRAGVVCEELMIPVAVEPGLPATERMHADLCVPDTPTSTIHVLVTPSVTNRFYFDPEFQPELYSYADALNRAGYATLNLEAIGSGKSSKPLSVLVTVDAYVDQVHSIITRLRDGALAGRSFDRVVTNGLSNGTLVAMIEAAKYQDVDGLILTGVGLPNGPNLARATVTKAEPAFLEPKFAGMGLDPGYATFKADFYQRIVLSPDGYDPRVVEYALEGQDLSTFAYFATIAHYVARFGYLQPISPSSRIRVPVLVGNGGQDQLFCGKPPFATDCSSADGLRRSVEDWFPNVPRLDAFILPKAGHDMNYALNATDWFAHAIVWSEEVVVGV